MTWNVRGSGSYRKRSIKQVISIEDPNIVVLQEVKKEYVDRSFVGSVWRSRFKEWILLPSTGRSRGILLMWDTRRVRVSENLVGNFSISICIKTDNLDDWWFTGIYGLPCASSRAEFWDELVSLWKICGRNWCLGGNFNVARNIQEKRNNLSNTRSLRTFDELIRELELQDPPLINAQRSNFKEHPICCRML